MHVDISITVSLCNYKYPEGIHVHIVILKGSYVALCMGLIMMCDS